MWLNNDGVCVCPPGGGGDRTELATEPAVVGAGLGESNEWGLTCTP